MNDDWHPVSQRPTLMDFEPFGVVDVWEAANPNAAPYQVTGDQRWNDVMAAGATHWRKVVPPKLP